VIHREDLRRIAPLWMSITEQIRADKAHWNPEWNGITISKVFSMVIGDSSWTRGRTG
jgi:hypothetical protein